MSYPGNSKKSTDHFSVGKEDLPFWAGKMEIQKYLEDLNKDGKVSSIPDMMKSTNTL